MDSNVLSVFLLDGQITHKFELLGREIVLDLFPVGTSETIERQASGLDLAARRLVVDILDLSHAIRSVGGYDFKQSLDEKLKFVRSLNDQLFQWFVSELRSAQFRQRETLTKRRDELKKSSPNQG
jgi:hypothetical protein